MKLESREWGFFVTGEIFTFSNSVAYHKKNLNVIKQDIPYISRTNKNNGLEEIIEKSNNLILNKKNTIVFGAENATFFFQPFEYITGNKMYVIFYNKINNKYIGIFINTALNKSVKNCGFGYGQGLTATREKRRPISLPVNKNNKPDCPFMEYYAKSIFKTKDEKYLYYIKKVLEKLEYKKIVSLQEKEWREFFISDICEIRAGKRLTKADMKEGNKPFIGSSDSNNGITNFVSNTNNSEDFNVLGVNYNGSVVENFYHPYKAIFSDDVKRLSLKDIEGNEYLYLFIKNVILKQKSKYQYAYKFNEKRLKRQKILLPVNDKEEPDYVYMEQYIKNIKVKKIKQYLDFKMKTDKN